ncbi:MAG: hypothetical protein RJB14_2173 [Pseudomonadota bacterium]|jgi:uncharacterized DUF497 family protein
MYTEKTYNWNADKNQWLVQERGISFERIVFEISLGNEVTVLMHPNQTKYPGQMISVVQVDDYVYLVPFIETDSEIFLKTIIPSRKAKRQFGSKP